jgi:hypothetical protein
MPASWDEFTVTEVAAVLGESRGTAEDLLDLAHDLEVKLPGTRAAFRDGTLRLQGRDHRQGRCGAGSGGGPRG